MLNKHPGVQQSASVCLLSHFCQNCYMFDAFFENFVISLLLELLVFTLSHQFNENLDDLFWSVIIESGVLGVCLYVWLL